MFVCLHVPEGLPMTSVVSLVRCCAVVDSSGRDDKMLFSRGVPSCECVLILAGAVLVTAGEDGKPACSLCRAASPPLPLFARV